MTSRLFPPRASNDARVPRIAVAAFALITVLTLARSLAHLFAPDGGAQSIATVPLDAFSENGAATVVHLFALMVVEYAGRLALTFAKPVELVGTAPDAVGNFLMIPLPAGMLALWLRGRERRSPPYGRLAPPAAQGAGRRCWRGRSCAARSGRRRRTSTTGRPQLVRGKLGRLSSLPIGPCRDDVSSARGGFMRVKDDLLESPWMPDRPNGAVIRTRDLAKRYGDTVALAALDLEVPRNSIFGFLGPNGAGKSTAMKLLLGLSRPSGGSGTVFGLDIVRESLAIRERVGYLAQEPRFYGHMTARETLRFVLRFFGRRPERDVDARVAEALELVGLEAKADRPVRGFSGGERQRLGIAQASIHDPDLLILDEPAAALDPMGRSDVLAILARLRERATVFYSTHILDDVQRVSDRVAIVHRGRLVAQAPIESLLAGGEGTTYDVFLAGAPEGLQAQIEALPWVTAVTAGAARADAPGAAETGWRITVDDEDAADQELLRRLLREPEVRVRAFRRSTVELEDVFLDLVRGDADDRVANG